MVSVIITNKDDTNLNLEVSKITAVGFDCEIPLNKIAAMRDDASGRIRTFYFSLFLNAERSDMADIKGEISIHSIRRISQEAGIVSTRFVDLTEEQQATINEYATTGKVVSLNQARQKLRA